MPEATFEEIIKGLEPVPDDETTKRFSEAVKEKSRGKRMVAFFKDANKVIKSRI